MVLFLPYGEPKGAAAPDNGCGVEACQQPRSMATLPVQRALQHSFTAKPSDPA
ncbi:hypothetical protein IG631_14918 [Alternaria alternata]|nr:hypothetical protein IG631_14918 [Alternaria alternata]